MSIPWAVDLPVGSIIANSHTAWIKTETPAGVNLGSWLETGDDLNVYDFVPQEALDEGAKVLRVGDGSDR